jgi:allantoin racemase
VTETILVINPNSTSAVTAGIDQALQPLRMSGGPVIECATLEQGPPAIETQEHTRLVVNPLCERIDSETADAFVIACYSDPGLSEARVRCQKPVFGMAESGMLTALTRGGKFGVISILPAAVDRHVRYVESLGLTSRLAADLPVGLGVLELSDDAIAWPRLVRVGQTLRDDHSAASILLGCAGMAPYRGRLEQELGIPVIDPTIAAVTMAIGAVRVN